MRKYDCKNWTMNDIALAMKGRDSLDRHIVIPLFQRGKCWNSDKRDAFIDSLLKGYPVGTLLFADLGNKTFSIIDGLQRSTTVCEYILNPTRRENLKNIDAFVLEKCRQILFPNSLNHTIDDVINEHILTYISSKKTFDEVQPLAIAMELLNKIATTEDYRATLPKLGEVLEGWFVEYKRDFDSIHQTEIPIIIYSGDNIYLNDIFRRINIQGEPLDDYDVYAATWHSAKYQINKIEIVEHVIKKYDSLALDDYTIDSYSGDDLRRSRRLTIFEFLFGLGKHLQQNFPFLNSGGSIRADAVSSISFELVDACINDTKRIPKLADDIRDRSIDINLLERRIEESIKFVEAAVAPISNFRGNSRGRIQFLHPKYFALALIAFTFRQMYDINNLSAKRPEWNSKQDVVRQRILHHYVFELVKNEWHDGGIGKMYSAVKESSFLSEYTQTDWNNLLNGYFNSSLMNRQTKRFKNPTNADKLLLNCIYANIFTVADNFSASFFDIEHIATKEWMKRLIATTNLAQGLPVTHIANMCYLPENVNRRKREKTIYEDTAITDLFLVESKYSFTQRTDMDFLYIEYSPSNGQTLEENYIKFLRNRFEQQKQKIFSFLNI